MSTGQPLPGGKLGTFIKTCSHQTVEVLGTAGFSLGVIDAEHAPFDRTSMDLALLAGRAAGLPLYIRLHDKRPAAVLSALDMGAAGIVAPGVDTADQARQLVAWARYGKGERGYSGSPRSAGYGSLAPAEARALGDRTAVVCQIESVAGLANARAIAAVEGVAGLFIGRADLALSMNEPHAGSDAVLAASADIENAARKEGKTVWMYAAADEWQAFFARGIDVVLVESDQSLMRMAALAITTSVRRSS